MSTVQCLELGIVTILMFRNFFESLNGYRKQSTDKFQYLALSIASLAVQAHIHRRYNLGREDDTTQTAYLDLKAFDKMYNLLRVKELIQNVIITQVINTSTSSDKNDHSPWSSTFPGPFL